MKPLFIILILAGVLIACSSIQVKLRDKTAEQKVLKEKKINYYFWGLVSSENILHTKDMCQDSVLSNFNYKTNVVSGLQSFLTLGIYSPKNIEYQCIEKASNEKSN